MRRTLALLSAAALLGGGAAAAVAAASTLSFTSKTVRQSAVFTSTDDVFQGGKKVGSDRIVCTSASETTANCRVLVTLPKGTIRATFVSKDNASSGTLTVVGGTRGYKGATGTGTYKNLNKAGTQTAVTLNLK